MDVIVIEIENEPKKSRIWVVAVRTEKERHSGSRMHRGPVPD